jgi:hypothetical protein
VKLAYAELRVPIASFGLSLYAGKMDPVLGYEYRVEEAPDRLTVTPSLICRYTCGRPIGLKARARFLDERLVSTSRSPTARASGKASASPTRSTATT